MLDAILAANTPRFSFGLLDPKTECFVSALYLIAKAARSNCRRPTRSGCAGVSSSLTLAQADPVVTPLQHRPAVGRAATRLFLPRAASRR
jgi:hypothetical protein